MAGLGRQSIQDRLTIVAKMHAATQARAHFEFAASALDPEIVTPNNIDKQIMEAHRQAELAHGWLNAPAK